MNSLYEDELDPFFIGYLPFFIDSDPEEDEEEEFEEEFEEDDEDWQ